MKKLLICALALGGFAASARAADLSVDSLKDPLPEKISFAGVTLYGTVDVGYGYNSNGAPVSGAFYTGMDYVMYGSKQNRQAISAITNNALSQSQVGLKVEEAVGMGFVALAKIDTGFNPISGEIADACASLVRNNGKATNTWTSGLDGSRCGQAFNGQAYAGLSNPTYGTLTVGRQNSLDLDLMGSYDPMGGSYALSLIGFSGGAGAGIGSTETARWDNAVKYVYQFGPVHAGGMYSAGGEDTSIQQNAYAANVGATYKGFSLDAVYTKENGAVNSSTITYKTAAGGAVAGDGTCTLDGTGNACPGGNWLNASITDNEAWAIAGKYVMDLGGGFKDEGPSSKLMFFGGYQHSDLTNPGHAVALGSSTIGGYQMWTVNNQPFGIGSTKTLQTEWVGAKYETGPWALTAAYYHLSQNNYIASSLSGALTPPTAAYCATTATNAQKANCSGETNVVSGLVDYTFNKHFDVYAGVSWSDVTDGVASGFVAGTENTTVVSGLRLKF